MGVFGGSGIRFALHEHFVASQKIEHFVASQKRLIKKLLKCEKEKSIYCYRDFLVLIVQILLTDENYFAFPCV